MTLRNVAVRWFYLQEVLVVMFGVHLATTSTISPTTSGTYSVLVTDANGCTARDTVEVTIHIPQDNFLPQAVTLCVGDSLDALSGSSFSWSTGGVGQKEEILVSIIYTVSKLDNNGCRVYDTTDVTVNPYPVASFSFVKKNELPSTFDVDFSNLSTDADNVSWDFGDGSSSTQENPTHQYATGSYTAKLISTNSCGSDTFEMTVAHTAGVENHVLENLKVYPNPASKKLYVSYKGDMNVDEVVLYDLFGHVILRHDVKHNPNGIVEIDIHDVASGSYYLSINSEGAKSIVHMILTK